MVHTCLLRSQSCPCRVQGAAVLRWNRRRWWVRAARAVRRGRTYASQGSSAAYCLWFKKHVCIQMQCYVIVMLLTAPAPRKALAHRLEKQQCRHFTKKRETDRNVCSRQSIKLDHCIPKAVFQKRLPCYIPTQWKNTVNRIINMISKNNESKTKKRWQRMQGRVPSEEAIVA